MRRQELCEPANWDSAGSRPPNKGCKSCPKQGRNEGGGRALNGSLVIQDSGERTYRPTLWGSCGRPEKWTNLNCLVLRRISLQESMAQDTEPETGKDLIFPPAPKNSFLDRAQTGLLAQLLRSDPSIGFVHPI
jgi:hypothetical protein